MTAVAAGQEVSGASVWWRHLHCVGFPLVTLLVLLGMPYQDANICWWVMLILGAGVVDAVAPKAVRQPDPTLPQWPFDAVLVVLVMLQVANILVLGWKMSMPDVPAWDAFMAALMVGANSGYSAIVVAHELVHRPQRAWQRAGRFLLWTVMYDHFHVEHVRGHHHRIGTPEDPATARFEETFRAFMRRTVTGQFRSAWRLENKRLGNVDMPVWDRRQLGNRVLHGLVGQGVLAVTLAVVFGPLALLVFLVQAWNAITLLEAVNYFEHWGLLRRGRKATTVDSWDADSSYTLYSLVGLSRHADHHANASRPYQQLRHFEESPKLPSGYVATVLMVLFANGQFRRLATQELKRKHLGPFVGVTEAAQ